MNDKNGNKAPRGAWLDTVRLLIIVWALVAVTVLVYLVALGTIGSSRVYTGKPNATTAPQSSTTEQGTTAPIQSTSDTDTTTATNTAATTATNASATVAPPIASKGTVFIDAGHGGSDVGTKGTLNGTTYYEKDINLSISLLLRDELIRRGYNVVMSRDTDKAVELNSRAPLAQEANADLFISVHCNSFAGSGRAYGPIVIYTDRKATTYNKTKLSGYFSDSIDNMRLIYPEMRVSRVRSDMELRGGYLAVLAATDIPSLIVEVGFMSDSSDLQMMIDSDWQKNMVRALSDAVDISYNKGLLK